MATNYITDNQLKKTLELTGETFADDDVTAAVSAASRSIDDVTHRRFYADSTASVVRYYSPGSPRRVSIDDLVTLTELAVGPGDNTFPTVLTLHTDFELAPLNATADVRPSTSIKALTYQLPCGVRTVRVTGKFGWPSVPDEIEQATSILAAKLLKRSREATFGIVGFGMEGGYARITKSDPDVMMLIGPFIRPLVG